MVPAEAGIDFQVAAMPERIAVFTTITTTMVAGAAVECTRLAPGVAGPVPGIAGGIPVGAAGLSRIMADPVLDTYLEVSLWTKKGRSIRQPITMSEP